MQIKDYEGPNSDSPREDRDGFGEIIDQYLMGLSKKFMKYRLNIFLLNRVGYML